MFLVLVGRVVVGVGGGEAGERERKREKKLGEREEEREKVGRERKREKKLGERGRERKSWERERDQGAPPRLPMKNETKKENKTSLFLSIHRFSFLTFAAGCSTSSSLRIVAPSLVMVTSPMSSTSI